MKYVLTNAQMRAADKYTIESLGEPSLALMERAGIALADEAETLAPRGKIVCFCGGGNNGGDGYVCARHLLKRGREVVVVAATDKHSPECEINRVEFEMLGGEVFDKLPSWKISLLIDCLFGTGFRGELTEELAENITKINALKARGTKILSADIPSGISGENGFSARVAVNADVTLCIGELKAGVFLNDGIDYSGVAKKADIGIFLDGEEKDYTTLIEKDDVARLLPVRKRNSHKGVYGKTAIVAGCETYTGAAYLSTLSSLRSGVGYTTLFTPANILPYYALKAPEALLEPLNEGGMVAFNEENFEKLLSYDCIAYGMGTGVSEDVFKGAQYLLKNYTGKLVLDADALNSISKYEKDVEGLFQNKLCDVLITPHVKEFSRLSGLTVTEILSGGLFAARGFAKQHGVTVLLKNAVTTVTDGNRVALTITGTAGQAKGGSGDVLSGVIAGLCGSGLSVFNGGVVGAYVTGKAAEFALLKESEYSLLATDVISSLGAAFRCLRD